MLSCNNESLTIENEDAVEPEEQKYVSLCNRWGLIKPSDIVFISCLHAWSLYSFLLNDTELMRMLLSSNNPRAVFVQVFIHELIQSRYAEALLNETCQLGCAFQDKLEQIALATFNIKAKNYASAGRDNLRAKQKRHGNYKQSPILKKVKKLSSL